MTDLQFTGLLKLHHVALSLEGTACGQENVLVTIVDVFCPIRQPSNGIIMLDRLPFSWHVRDRNGCIFANIQRYVFGTNAELYEISVKAFTKITVYSYL